MSMDDVECNESSVLHSGVVVQVAYLADVWDVMQKVEYSVAKQNELLSALVATNQRIAVALENKGKTL